ncbi:telomeric repeat-binding factor 1 isoform X2 [Corythoichthys intestinalis]|uniref:telomeric repeat-binding factor 1 isoform X2 n=1 Tax=Corythoichthys intestinalis TaxID=161448 RepID=UPI0025A59EDE|nr:telomeric repeat-binding factor 1 isoform X2 [Corythoichthys intestinalis]
MNMEQQVSDKKTTKTLLEEDYDTGQLNAVASKWIRDFLFIGVCRRFREQNQDAFKDAISTYKSVSQTPLLEAGSSDRKGQICDFLARVIQGKQLGTRFEEDDDESVMPLMSAAKVWFYLKDVVEDEGLFDNVTLLLIIQSVAVCLEKGQKKQATGALKWFEEHVEYPRKVGAKLATIVAQMDTYHQFLTVFSFARLLESVQTFLHAYLAKHPSDFLLKEAITAVQSAQNTDATDGVAKEDKSFLEAINRSKLKTKAEENIEVVSNKKSRLSIKLQSVNEFLTSDVSSDGGHEQSVDSLGDTILSTGADQSQNDDDRLEHNRLSRKKSRGRRLYSSNSSQLDASPDQSSIRKENARFSSDDKANQSGVTTTKNKRKLFSARNKMWEPDAQI